MAAMRKTAPCAKGARPNPSRPRRYWENWTDEKLLELRLCDLDLDVEHSVFGKRVAGVLGELEARRINLKPYFWISDNWFTPQGLTGIALPFFLAHPRLQRLERSRLGEAEGGSHRWCMQLLRHELGHALDHAFRLHTRRRRQKLFGISSTRYAKAYQPRPGSKRFVQHLDDWYAQSHPDEDFAETFAVWLTPRSNWRDRYRGWPALQKLRYVDELMAELEGRRPLVSTRARVDPLGSLRMTLGEYYRKKAAKYTNGNPDSYDRDLLRVFSPERGQGVRAASALLRENRRSLIREAAVAAGGNEYLARHVLREMIVRCRELGLCTGEKARRLRPALVALVGKHIRSALANGWHWVEM